MFYGQLAPRVTRARSVQVVVYFGATWCRSNTSCHQSFIIIDFTSIYYDTDATDSVGEEREDIQTREQPPCECKSDEKPHDTNSIYIKRAKVGANGRKKPKIQRPRPNRPPETLRTTEQRNADPAQETQTQRNSNDDGNNNDEFRRKFRELNLSRTTQNRYATRSNTDTIRMIADQCGPVRDMSSGVQI